MMRPQQVDEAEHEIAVARVAAIDVAKASGMACTRVPRTGEPGRFVTEVWTVAATTNAILELADHLRAVQVEKVVLESTSDYWRPFFYLLEAAGLTTELVNARDVKNAPGRPKTDKLDAVWLAKLAAWGMLRPSFVPPPQIRRLRDYTRLRTDLVRERGRHWQRMEKLLEDAQLTELRGWIAVSGRPAMTRAARFPARGQRRGWRAGSVVAEGAALRSA
jgi:transposase